MTDRKIIKFNDTSYVLGAATIDGVVSLGDMKSAALVELHNLAGGQLYDTKVRRVNKFSDKSTAVKRTWAVLELYEAEAAQELEGTTTTTATPTPPKRRKSSGRFRRMNFNFPAADEIKSHREGTMRAKLIELFSRKNGATFEEAVAATWGAVAEERGRDQAWARKIAYEGVRLVHLYVGYGMRQGDDGRIKIFTKN